MDERIAFAMILVPAWVAIFGVALWSQWRRRGTLEHWSPSILVVLLVHAWVSVGLSVAYLARTGLSLDYLGQSNTSFGNFIIANLLSFMVVDLVIAAALRTEHRDTYLHHLFAALGACVVLYYDVSAWEYVLALVAAEISFCFYLRRLLQMIGYGNRAVLGMIARWQVLGTLLVRGIVHPVLGLVVVLSPAVMLAVKVLTVSLCTLGLYWAFILVRNRMRGRASPGAVQRRSIA